VQIELRRGMGRPSLGEPAEQLGMGGDEFINRGQKGGFLSRLKEHNEFLHRSLFLRRKLRHEIGQVFRLHPHHSNFSIRLRVALLNSDNRRTDAELGASPRMSLPNSWAQVLCQPDDITGVASAHFLEQIIRQLVEFLFEKAAVAVGRVHVAAADHVAQPKY